ncbi:ABC transporter permease [Clostridium sp. MSJ-4]|uniref:ABC transporter permease n=1 Tax=Clostridium simiarum TaxID=2841506 RepID=A0ABS6F4C8_9CLOT|nr:ABC transporter permease [Clostridium simiarum]MBU5593344.1 ABC transporter permease [Clostridium simiarum]
MRFLPFAIRNYKELLRDLLSLVFSMGLPIIFLLMQKNMPIYGFKIENFTPGVVIFSFAFISLFSGMLIAKDRCSSFLTRLFASPLSAFDYIVGYSLPLLLMALLQSIVCFITAIFLGLPLHINILLTILLFIPVAMLFIGIGLLLGCVFNDKQVGGIASILITFSTLASGMWFDLNLMGNTLKTIARVLPFAHAVDAARATLTGNYASILPHLPWVLGHAIVTYIVAVLIFRKRMLNGNM